MEQTERRAIAEKLQDVVKLMAGDDRGFAQVEKEMLAYMYGKYGVEFQVERSSKTIYSDGYDCWHCSIRGNTDENAKGKIEVHRWRNRKNNLYADTYLSILIRGENEKRVNEALEGYMEPLKVANKSLRRIFPMPLTDEELLLLNSLMYLEDSVTTDSRFNTVGDIVNHYLDNPSWLTIDKFSGGFDLVLSEGQEHFQEILEEMQKHERLMNLGLGEVTKPEKDDLIRGRCFIEYDEEGNAMGYVVAFRGTGGSEEAWQDNTKGLYMQETPAQEQAKEFVAGLGYDNLTVTGHSKGGNLAMYVTANEETANLIQRCVSFDGQGMNAEFVDAMSIEQLEIAKGKIKSISTYNDPVNQLLTPVIGENLYFNNNFTGALNLKDRHSVYSLYASNKEMLAENNGMFTREASIEPDQATKDIFGGITNGANNMPVFLKKTIADGLGWVLGKVVGADE